MKLYACSVQEILDLYKRKEISRSELFDSLLARIELLEGKIGAFITQPEKRSTGEAIGKSPFQEDRRTLPGIPVAVKDNILTRGTKTTCASRILSDFLPAYDATAVSRLQEAGGIVFGKTNLDEFAMGSSCENSGFKITRNPWDLGRVPGGSSGGSAAAVAAGMCPAALGSDTGGSVRQPASLCGVVGLKPTYGRVSRYGLVAFGSSLDQIGIITRTVFDNALLLNIIAGHDHHDSTSSPVPAGDFTAAAGRSIRGMRLGFPREYFGKGLADDVKEAVMIALKEAEKLGAEVQEISLPHTDHAIPAYYLTATAEASSNLARYDGVRYGFRDKGQAMLDRMYSRSRKAGFGKEVKRRIMLGTYALSAGYYDAYYLKAQKVRTLIREDFLSAFRKVDCVITPTTPTTAFKIGEKVDDPLQMYLSDIYTVTINLAGVPAISIPCGFSPSGLPIGLQIIGNFFGESDIYRAASALESALGTGNRVAEP